MTRRRQPIETENWGSVLLLVHLGGFVVFLAVFGAVMLAFADTQRSVAAALVAATLGGLFVASGVVLVARHLLDRKARAHVASAKHRRTP